MTFQIRKAAILGAGVMGAAIAAHLANVGIQVLLLDIAPDKLSAEEESKGLTLASPAVRNRFALRGLQAAKKSKPAAFYDDSDASLIQIGNLTDNLAELSDCDWVIEAVVENLSIKQQVLANIERAAREDAIISSNTSGISIKEMVQNCSESFRKRFLGTHFFNPPRYMKLLEIIPGPDTNPEIVKNMSEFGERILGKGTVLAKDTPNFIANRIGTYGLLVTLSAMERFKLGVDEVDALTGPVLGRPKSATFRTLDIVGLDTFLHVAKNVASAVTDPDEKKAFTVPVYLEKMVENRWLGDKSGQGFFKRVKTEKGKEILALDLQTLTYNSRKKVKFASFEMARNAKTLGEKINALAYGKDAAAEFVWYVLKKVLLYCASRQSEIALDIVSVDNAMKWGFNWELGPYEIWDILGIGKSVARMRAEGEKIPTFIEDMLQSGKQSFYKSQRGNAPSFYDLTGEYKNQEIPGSKISLRILKEQEKVIKKNSGASLIDIGDGIVCLDFHSPKQAIGVDVTQMIDFAITEVSKNWEGLVIANEASNFCVGANLMLMLMEAQDENWDEIDQFVRRFQQTLMRLKYLPKPVVAAPFNMTLGGGAEVCFPADRIQASSETYMGLVEVGVGLIPGGGGNKELLIRAIENVPQTIDDRLDSYVRKVFETIATAKVSTSAKEAKKYGFLRQADGISVSRDFLIHDAKQVALGLAKTGYMPRAKIRVPVIGESGAALLQMGVYGMKQSGYISDHDVKIAHHLIRLLTGGAVPRGTLVTEDYLLDLEREAFLSLIGERKTQERMQYMLTVGKPLRN